MNWLLSILSFGVFRNAGITRANGLKIDFQTYAILYPEQAKAMLLKAELARKQAIEERQNRRLGLTIFIAIIFAIAVICHLLGIN